MSAPATGPTHVYENRGRTRPTRGSLRLAQDGHSFTEEAIYQLLWKQAGSANSNDPYRETAVGQATIGKHLRLARNTVKRNLRSLSRKLSIEPIANSYDPETSSPTKYLAYSYAAMIERRKSAGFQFYTRNRGGVVLSDGLPPAGGAETMTPGATETHPPGSRRPRPPVPQRPHL